MSINLVHKLAGRYTLSVYRKDGSRRVHIPWFCNLITDLGLNRMGNNPSQLNYCSVGSGATAPNVADTVLGNRIATTSTVLTNNTVTTVSSPYYTAIQKTYRFAEGAAAGNITEVGVGWDNSTYLLFSRALILDSGGNPTTITVLGDEFLEVTYELRNYAPEVDSTGTLTLDGDDYDWTARAASAGTTNWISGSGIKTDFLSAIAFDGAMGALTSTPSGASDVISSAGQSYSNDSFQRDNVVSAGLSDGNFGSGLKSIFVTNTAGPHFQIEFDPAIPKDNTKTLSLTLRHSWARASI